MNKKQKRRAAVARDVIAQLNIGSLNAQAGIYTNGRIFWDAEVGDSLQKLIKTGITKKQPCEVCAMGACFISSVKLFNKFDVNRSVVNLGEVPTSQLKRKVAEIFPRREMGVIESCFERRESWLKNPKDLAEFLPKPTPHYSSITQPTGRPILRDLLDELTDENRLIFLMEVVLANPTTTLTMRVVKNTLLRFLADGKYAWFAAKKNL